MTTDKLEQKIEIEWSYTPLSYFEDRMTLKHENYCLEIYNGKIIAKMSAEFFDSNTDIRASVYEEVKMLFLGAQPFRRQLFNIQGGCINRIWPNGRIDKTIVVHSAVHRVTCHQADISYTDQNGILHDTRQIRIENTKKLMELSLHYGTSDQTAGKILDSFNSSVKDPENELVHLFEIWDALKIQFGDEKNAMNALNISKLTKKKLTGSANNKELKQGRHRGQHLGSLRTATMEELEEAREAAINMISNYLNFLDNKDK